MNDQYIFVCTNIGNEKLLKEEVQVFHPELTLSYSRKGFLTFKNKGVLYDLKTISQLELCFSTRVGICLGKSTPEGLINDLKKADLNVLDLMIHSFSVNTDYRTDVEGIFDQEVNKYSADGKKVLNIITLGENEVWFGIHSVVKGTTRFPNSFVKIDVPDSAPSKSYLKLAQIVELYAIKFNGRDAWLDFGSAPGGASFYLLSKGHKVWGIDPAKMDPTIALNPNYTHISKAVQDLSQEKLPDGEIHWVHVDLNINPNQAIKEVLRLIKKYNNSIKGIIFTIQIVKMDYVKDIENFEEQFYDWGFNEIKSLQVPAHKNEYVIIATK